MATEKILIKGITTSGAKFRPSDWAQRLATAVGSSGPGRRIKYHPKVQIALVEGINCVVVTKDLEEESPMLYSFLTNFANTNHLQVEDYP